MESDSSESVLTRALREGQGLGAQAAPDGAQVAQVAPADLNAAVGRRWRSKRTANRTRKARVCFDALQGIADRVGIERRTPTRTETADNDGHVRQGFVRKIKAGSFTKKKMIEMALPQISRETPSSRLSLPNAVGHAGACGVHLKSIRRARELALNAITDQTECKLSQLAEASRNGMFMQEPVAFKISWDETALRFRLCVSLLPSNHGGLMFAGGPTPLGPPLQTLPMSRRKQLEQDAQSHRTSFR